MAQINLFKEKNILKNMNQIHLVLLQDLQEILSHQNQNNKHILKDFLKVLTKVN